MKKDPLHKKITDTAKRLQYDGEFEEDEVILYDIKKDDISWIENLKNLTNIGVAPITQLRMCVMKMADSQGK